VVTRQCFLVLIVQLVNLTSIDKTVLLKLFCNLRGGAPSLIAATELSDSRLNDRMMEALFDAMWPGVLSTFDNTAGFSLKYHRIGDILNYAKSYLLTEFDPDNEDARNDEIRNHFEIYHLIGDPTLQLWTDEPVNLTLDAYIKKHILFINLNICPNAAVLTVWNNERLIRTIRPTGTRVSLPLDNIIDREESTQDLTVCFSAPGCRFVEVPNRDYS